MSLPDPRPAPSLHEVGWSGLMRSWQGATPPQTICLGFVVIILIGAFFLWLPVATASGQWNTPLIALFTSTSAVCVTGLVMVDTGSYFSPFGQAVILLLIQVGGLGYMTATSFFLLLVGRRLSLRDHMTLQEAVGSVLGESGVLQLVFSVIAMTVMIEGMGAFLLSQTLIPQYGWVAGSWSALFHSVSAFNNAGFSLYSDSLTQFRGDFFFNGVISSLVILGGIGYSVILEAYRRLRSWSSRSGPRGNFSLNFKIAISITILLLGSGTLFFFGTELQNARTLAPLPIYEKVLAAWFQSMTARTAGFHTIEQGSLNASSVCLMLVFMFIGASPGGTGGGVKTTTLGALLSCTKSALEGQPAVVMFQRRLPETLIHKAVGILMGSVIMVSVCTTLLVMLDGDDFSFLGLLFEAVSAYATVGLSAVNTPDLSSGSHLVLIPTMYCGRVGVLFLISALLGKQTRNTLLKYPEEPFLVG